MVIRKGQGRAQIRLQITTENIAMARTKKLTVVLFVKQISNKLIPIYTVKHVCTFITYDYDTDQSRN